MSIRSDLETEVDKIFREPWTVRDGQVVPETENVGLGNDGIKLNITVLYADLADSTKLVDNYKAQFAAENYKAYLRCAARIIRSRGGHIRAYDGDRVMGIFIGNSKNTSAVRAALEIHWAVADVIRPKMKSVYTEAKYVMKHVVGIDATEALVARTGIRGSNDLVWLGSSANYAAKLSNESDAYQTWITHRIYDNMNDEVKFSNGANMWKQFTWTKMNNMRIYASNYKWTLAK